MTELTAQRCWVAAVIRDDVGNVLVARWAGTHAWDLPAGVLRLGEDVCTRVRRVVPDTVTVGETVGWLVGIHTHVRNGMTLIFLARHVVGQIQPGPGVACCRWVPVVSAAQTLPPPAAELIQHATTGTVQATIGHQSLDTVARLRVAR